MRRLASTMVPLIRRLLIRHTSMMLAVLLQFLPQPVVSKQASTFAGSGQMSLWSDAPRATEKDLAAKAFDCRIAEAPGNGGLYFANGHYCAANVASSFDGGKSCGRCLRITYSDKGQGDRVPGRSGSIIAQILSSGNMGRGTILDCHQNVFVEVTGTHRGFFPVTYEEVDCTQEKHGAVATVLQGDTAYYTRLVFSNLHRPAREVFVEMDGQRYELALDTCCGTWSGALGGELGHLVSFTIRADDGTTSIISDCFPSWPVAAGTSCIRNANMMAAADAAAAAAAALANGADREDTSGRIAATADSSDADRGQSTYEQNMLRIAATADGSDADRGQSTYEQNMLSIAAKPPVDETTIPPATRSRIAATADSSDADRGQSTYEQNMLRISSKPGHFPPPDPSTCAKSWSQDCRISKCCKEEGHICYTKNEAWAACRPRCKAGEVDKDDGRRWECKDLTHPLPCSASWTEDCSASLCCNTSWHKCYRKKDGWAACRPSCKKGSTDDFDDHPWECSDMTYPSLCSKSRVEDCRTSRCCKEEGFKCYEKDDTFAACLPDCDEMTKDTDSALPWSCTNLSGLADSGWSVALKKQQQPGVVAAGAVAASCTLALAILAVFAALSAFAVMRTRREQVEGDDAEALHLQQRRLLYSTAGEPQ